jgi:hypothetical protein
MARGSARDIGEAGVGASQISWHVGIIDQAGENHYLPQAQPLHEVLQVPLARSSPHKEQPQIPLLGDGTSRGEDQVLRTAALFQNSAMDED